MELGLLSFGCDTSVRGQGRGGDTSGAREGPGEGREDLTHQSD